MTNHAVWKIIGCASGLAGADPSNAEGPSVIRQSTYMQGLLRSGLPLEWVTTISEPESISPERLDEAVREVCEALAKQVVSLVSQSNAVCVIAGDHTSAIGTFSGVYQAIHTKGELGLIWLDAHLDSHTPETTESGRIHGMPLACLLGYGYPTLTTVGGYSAKLKPENVCCIGTRSFEKGEQALLERLNVRIYYMDEVKERGFPVVMQEAIAHVNRHTIGYGVSLDMDVVDPLDAPGVDVSEKDGIHAVDLLEGMRLLQQDKRLLAAEIVEFDPKYDVKQITEKLVIDVLKVITSKV